MSNYVTWTAVRLYGAWVGWEYRDARYSYYTERTGRQGYRATWYVSLATCLIGSCGGSREPWQP